MDVVLLHNEKAGNSDWTRNKLIRLVEDAGFKVRYCPLKLALEEPKRLERGEFAIVAAGDGGIRKAALALLGRKQPMAPLPVGTANNIAHSLGVGDDVRRIVAGWRKPRRCAFDVGVIEGPWGRRQFIEGVGIGLVSRAIAVLDKIDEMADFAFKKRKHKLHRDVCVAAALAHEMQALHADLTFDGRDVSADFLLLEILNIRRAGPGLQLAPQASPSDSRFDVVTVTDEQRERLLTTLTARLNEDTAVRSLTTRRARRLHVRLNEACDLRIDDSTQHVEAGTALEISLKPKALEFILPAS